MYKQHDIYVQPEMRTYVMSARVCLCVHVYVVLSED